MVDEDVGLTATLINKYRLGYGRVYSQIHGLVVLILLLNGLFDMPLWLAPILGFMAVCFLTLVGHVYDRFFFKKDLLFQTKRNRILMEIRGGSKEK